MAGQLGSALGLVGVAAALLLAPGEGCSSDKASCSVFDGSNYAQSCATDSDCVVVSDPRFCCGGPVINVTAQAQYMAAVRRESAGCTTVGGCNVSCGAELPCCIGGMCQIAADDMCGATAADSGAVDAAEDAAACVPAGGSCITGGALRCPIVGPQPCGARGVCCLVNATIRDASTD